MPFFGGDATNEVRGTFGLDEKRLCIVAEADGVENAGIYMRRSAQIYDG